MRKWYVPLTIAGLGGLGAFLLSESGREALRRIGRYLRLNSQGAVEWDEAAEAELDRLRTTLSTLADSLQPRAETSR